MQASNHCRQDVARLGVEVVSRSVEIGRHRCDEASAVLAIVALAHRQAGNLGDCISLVGRFEGTSEQMLLFHRLRRMFWVDAGAAKEQQLVDPGGVGGRQNVGLNLQIDANEVRRESVVGQDSSDLRCSQKHVSRACLVEERRGCSRVGEIELGLIAGDEVVESERPKPLVDRRANETSVSGDEGGCDTAQLHGWRVLPCWRGDSKHGGPVSPRRESR